MGACLIENKLFGNQVVIDYDIFFRDFENIGIPYTCKLIDEVEKRLRLKISASYRSSSSGNTHLRLRFPVPLSVFEGFEIRMFMGDCQDRLRLDMVRYFRTQDLYEINKAFDQKYIVKCGETANKKAGGWKPLPRDVVSEKKCGEIWQELQNMEQTTKTRKLHPENATLAV